MLRLIRLVRGCFVGLNVNVFMFCCNNVFNIVLFELSDIFCLVELLLSSIVILLYLFGEWVFCE